MRHTLLSTLSLLPLALIAPEARLHAAVQEDDTVERGLLVQKESAFDGYTLISPLRSKMVHLVDIDGRVAHTWETEHRPAGGVYLMEDGSLLRCAIVEDNPRFEGGGMGGALQRIAWDGTVVWDHRIVDDYQTQHHDIEPLPNGNLLAIVWEHRYREDAVQFGRARNRITEKGMWPDAVLELRPLPPDDAEVVWEWHVWDHLIQDENERAEGYGSIPDHPERVDINADHRNEPPMTEEQRKQQKALFEQMRALGYAGGGSDDGDDDADDENKGRVPDWLHTNAVDYHPELDLIVLSTPHLSEVWVIDHSLSTEDAAYNRGGRFGKGGGLLYRWGNPKVYGAGTKADQKLFYQHDPTWIGGADDLRLLIYNNGGGRPGGDHSSIDEIVLPFDRKKGFLREPGQAFGPAEPVWTYSDPENFFSAFISGAQRLPNGNTLICEGAKGRVFEVTRGGEIVWDYLNPHGGDATGDDPAGSVPTTALFRATRIARSHPGLKGKSL